MVKICVIVLIGLPGAGKTTFCKKILSSNLKYNFLHICYDDIFKFHPKQLYQETFKDRRRKVIEQTEKIISEIKMNDQEEDSNVILIDDNNYYAGMRYEFFKLCKRNELSFGQVFFAIDVECALIRNSHRDSNKLPSHVIEKMHKRLEIPSHKNQWEQNTIMVKNSEKIDDFESFLKVCFLNILEHKIISKSDNDVHKINFVHSLDLCLRKRISEILRNSNGNINEKAKTLNEKRKRILLDIKTSNEINESINIQSICHSLNY